MWNIFKKITNAGVTANMDFHEVTRLRGMNIACMIGIALVPVTAGLGFDSRPFVWNLFYMMIVLSLSILFNYFNQIKLARYFIIAATFLWFIEASIGFGSQMGHENYFYVVLVCLLIFGKKDGWLFLNATIITLTLITVKLYQQNYPALYPLPRLSNLFYITNLFCTCFVISILCWCMLKDVNNYQCRILESEKVLKNSNELKDKLLSIVGHDLRSPINSLKASLDLLEDGHLSKEEQSMVIDGLKESLEKSETILNDVLEWSSQNYLQSSARIVRNEKVLDIHETCEQVLELYKDTAIKKNVALINRIPLGTMVLADYDQLLFIVRNLIGNALKFSSYDGTGQVIAETKMLDDMLEVSIIDNGTGIAENSLKNLFKLDKRISTEGTLKEKGSGLGLVFCKEFVENNGGNITVKSELGKGSTFSFTLKLSKKGVAS